MRKYRVYKIRELIILILAICCSTLWRPALVVAQVDQVLPKEAFFEANSLYDQGQYQNSSQKYQDLISRGEGNHAVHYNLASSHWRKNELGAALFHFRKASELAPRDADTKYNLHFLRAKVKAEVRPVDFAAPFKYMTFNFLSEMESWLLLTLFVVFAGLFMIFGRMLSSDLLTWPTRAMFMGLFLMTTDLVVKNQFAIDYGVIQSKQVQVKSEIGQTGVVLFELSEGVEFEVTKEVNDWLAIRLSDGKRGWIEKEDGIFN